MASTTTNIGLTKPAGTDQALISAINGNMDIIDTKMGAVGNTSVQSQITSLSDQISTLNSKTTSTASQIFTPSSGVTIVNGTLVQTKRANIAMISFSVKKSDETAFTGNRVSVGSFASGWIPNNRQIIPVGGGTAINGYVNSIAGNMFIDTGGGVNVDLALQTVKEIHIGCTLVLA